MIPVRDLVIALHLYDSRWALIFFHTAFQTGFCTLFMRNFIRELPDSILDAARIEGAGELRIFRHVVLPLIRPAIAAVSVLVFTFRVERRLLVAGSGAVGQRSPAHRRAAIVTRHVADLVAAFVGRVDSCRVATGRAVFRDAAPAGFRAHRGGAQIMGQRLRPIDEKKPGIWPGFLV
jgi:hypothetical protein